MCNVNLEGKKFYHVLKDFYLLSCLLIDEPLKLH